MMRSPNHLRTGMYERSLELGVAYHPNSKSIYEHVLKRKIA